MSNSNMTPKHSDQEIFRQIEWCKQWGYESLQDARLSPFQIDQLRILGYKVKRDYIFFFFPLNTYTISWQT